MLNSVDVKLQYDDKNKAELIENAEIKNTEPSDFGEIVRILSHTFEYDGYGMPPHQILNLMEMELRSSRVDLENSVKLVDKRDGKIYGLLVFSHYNLATGSPLLTRKSTAMIAEYLMGYSQINGFAFLIDKRLRGVGLDRKMIVFAEPFLKQFDFVWCATEYESKSNAYWQRYGFVQIWEDEDSCFYIRNTGKSNMNDVLILKMASEALNSKENAKGNKDDEDDDLDDDEEDW